MWRNTCTYGSPNTLKALRLCIDSLIGYYAKFLSLLCVKFYMSWVAKGYYKMISLRSWSIDETRFTEQYDYGERLHCPRRNNYSFRYLLSWKVAFKYEAKNMWVKMTDWQRVHQWPSSVMPVLGLTCSLSRLNMVLIPAMWSNFGQCARA